MILFLLASFSNATPLQYNHQGRLLDIDGNGLSGEHQLTFRIVDASDSVLWEEALDIEFENGYYSVHLGEDEANNPLDDSVLLAYPLWMELAVDGDTLEPRHPIQSVPYANIAGMAEAVDGGSVNASDISVNGAPVIDEDGNWVGPQEPTNWTDIEERPPGLDDGDDDTQLTQAEVVDYVNGSQVNLGAASQVDGADIVTAGSFDSYLPADLSDGDADTLASLSCGLGEIASWDGNSAWVCTSDASLEWADIENMLNNNAVDLNVGTTIGGTTIVTSATDADSFASMSCQNDGEVLKFDTAQGTLYCDIDVDTDSVLSDSEVLGYVNGQALSLTSGTQVDGSNVVTEATFANNLPSDLADGDNDTQLTSSEVETIVESIGSLELSGNVEVSGSATFNDTVTAENGLTVNGALVNQTVQGPYSYLEFTTDKVTNSSTSQAQVYTLLEMRCSGHWGSYFAEIDLITYYYRPSVRRYEYYCGHGDHTSGGTLVEIQSPQAVGSLVSLSKTSPVDSGLDHANIRMYDVQLEVTQGPYVQSYARIRSYGIWPAEKSGTSFSETYPSAVWSTWTK